MINFITHLLADAAVVDNPVVPLPVHSSFGLLTADRLAVTVAVHLLVHQVSVDYSSYRLGNYLPLQWFIFFNLVSTGIALVKVLHHINQLYATIYTIFY